MQAIEFKQQTVLVAEHQEEYQTLPAHLDTDNGIMTFCWKVSWRERLKILFTGLLWHRVMTFNRSLQPQLLSTENPFVE